MKPKFKIGAFLLAVVMAFSALAVAGCTPISLKKEWSYKTSDNELAIGVYIYSLDVAYNRAKNFASELKDYDEYSDAWLDKEITDDDGNKAVAREWIKSEAEKMCLSYLAVEEQLKKCGAELSKAELASADEAAKTYWNVGPYASQGYVMPMKDDLEKLGISFESFAYCTLRYDAMRTALFDALYSEDGSEKVSDDELKKYFEDNYTDYSYFTVNLYSSTTDEAGEQVNKALSDKELKKLKDEMNGYAKSLSDGKSYKDVIKSYMDKNKVEQDPTVSNIEQLDNSTLGDEVKKELEKLESGKAKTVTVGEGDSAICYLIYKKDIKDSSKEYLSDDTNSNSVLHSMKDEDFEKYIEDLAKKLKHEKNSSVVDRYDPNMFYVKPEPTTAAAEEDTTPAA